MSVLVEPLVSCRLVERTKVLEIRTNFDEVEIILVYLRRKSHPATVPCHLQMWILFVDVLCQPINSTWLSIPSHESDTSDVLAVLLDKRINGVCSERHTNVLPQIGAMATRAMTGTTRNVDGKRHFIGYLLKNDVAVDVLEHSNYALACA